MQQIIFTCRFWGSCFNFSHSDTRIAHGRHVFHRIHSRLRNSVEDLTLFVPTKPSLWLVDSEKIFKVSTNQNDDLPIVAMFWQDLTNIVYTAINYLDFYFQIRFFNLQPNRSKNCPWKPCFCYIMTKWRIFEEDHTNIFFPKLQIM